MENNASQNDRCLKFGTGLPQSAVRIEEGQNSIPFHQLVQVRVEQTLNAKLYAEPVSLRGQTLLKDPRTLECTRSDLPNETGIPQTGK